MHRRDFCTLAAAAGVANILGSYAPAFAQAGNESDILLQQYAARMKWFEEARFGMFIHWGAYSALGRGEWAMHSDRMPFTRYVNEAAAFQPMQFSARKVVALAKSSGMKYIVITAKHHDGFCMWNSSLTDYNIFKWGKFGRDPMKEMAEECDKQGIRLGFYYSVRDWHHPDWTLRYVHLKSKGPKYGSWWGYAASPWTNGEVYDCGCSGCMKNKPITAEMDPRPTVAQGAGMSLYLDYMKGEITELLTHYGPVSIMWFDGQDIQNSKLGRTQEFVSIMRKLQPKVIINDRIGGDGTQLGDYGVHEGTIPGSTISRPWETCMTSNNSWGYTGNSGWKNPRDVIHALVDTTSKSGNLLFNIGPDGKGVVPGGCVAQLQVVGDWMRINEISIRGCGSVNLPQPDWGRITAGNNRLYLHVFDWPNDATLLVGRLSKPVKRAYLLADERRKPLSATDVGQGTSINLPRTAPDAIDSVVVIDL